MCDAPSKLAGKLPGWLIAGAIALGSGFHSAAAEAVDAPRLGKLLVQIESPYAETRRAAAEQLSGLTDPRALGALIAALRDESSDVRRVAIIGLAKAKGGAIDQLASRIV